MSYSKSFAILAFSFALTVALPQGGILGGSQIGGEAPKTLIKETPEAENNLRSQWTFGNCGTYVRTQDLVYYDHVRIQANSPSTTLSSNVGWVGTRQIYCIELIGNQGTQLWLQNGGIGYSSANIAGVSAVGKDLEGLVYIYGS